MNIKFFVKEHKFLYAAIIFSIILAMVPFIIFFTIEELRIASFVFILPTFLVIFVAIVANKTSKNYAKITKILSFILNIFILFFFQMFLSICIFIIGLLWGVSGNYSDAKDYNKALKKISWQEKVAHFPQVIPSNAQNIQLYQNYGSWFGSEGITLKFKADKDYINNEISKYNYVNIMYLNKYDESLYIYDDNGRIKTDECRAYIINDRAHEKLEGNYFPYTYGFCVNDNTNEIIYFYSNPD